MSPAARHARTWTLILLLLGCLAVSAALGVVGLIPDLVSLLGTSGPRQALLPAGLFYLAARGGRQETLAWVAGGVGVAGLDLLCVSDGAFPLELVGGGLGLSGLIALGVRAMRARGDARTEALEALGTALLVPLFILLMRPAGMITSALHPWTLDGALFGVDAALGSPTFVLGRLFAQHPWLRWLCSSVSTSISLAVGGLYLLRTRRGGEVPGRQILEAFVLGGGVGFLLHHACPAAGPRYAFSGLFPHQLPEVSSFELMPVPPAPRNCMPSLHTAWVVLLWWYSRGQTGPVRAGFLVWMALTLVATLGLGEHYVLDLVAGVPMAVLVDALSCRRLSWGCPERRDAIAGGAGLVVGWMVLVRFAPSLLARAPWLTVLLSVASVIASLRLRRRLLDRLAQGEAGPDEPGPEAVTARTEPWRAPLVALFFCSGFAGLIYEVAFGKTLALTFGSTARASTTVLATYMGGTALGTWAGGKIASRPGSSLRVYGLSELGIGLWCALTPLLFRAVHGLYLALASSPEPSSSGVLLQAALGGAVLLPATFLMGVTMPVLARRLLGGSGMGSAVGLLYGANTLGAALGALATGYLLLPLFGLTMCTLLAVGVNLVVALVALRLAKEEAAAPVEPAPEGEASRGSSAGRAVAVAVLFGSGLTTLGLEVLYTHLLAVVAGTSVYAFSLMLFAFLIGLGLGSAAMRAWMRGREASLAVVSGLLLSLAGAILLGVFVWEAIPQYFSSFAHYPHAQSFGAREVIRSLVCLAAMLPPALLIGALYPAAMACACRGLERAAQPGALGRAGALNTLGNVLGAAGAGFVLLPRLGSLRSLHAVAAMVAGLGLVPLTLRAGRSPYAAGLAAAVLALFLVQPRAFDLDRLASGANVYFEAQRSRRVVDHAESMEGGMTTVTESLDPQGNRVATLLTNGKFQGDNGPQRKAQYGFFLAPLLHTTQRGRALVIGVGTGATARVARDAGFERTDVVDLSADILAMGSRHFGELNDHVLSSPQVHTFLNDGRSFLELSQQRYDVIAIEVSSIWFAGASSLYNREFYQIAARRLAPRGVLEQWIQLHRLSPQDLLSIMGTMRSEFGEVWLYFMGGQGMLLACAQRCSPSAEALAAIDGTASLRPILEFYDGSARAIARTLLLQPRELDALLASYPGSEELLSTDDNLRLEYSTPRANVRSLNLSLGANLQFLLQAAPPERARELGLE